MPLATPSFGRLTRARPALFGVAMLCRGICGAAQTVELMPADRRPEALVEAAPVAASLAADRFILAPGFRASLWAAEPMLANPLAMSFDEQGRLFVAETHRFRTSSLDVRDYPATIEPDLASRTTADRARLIEETFGTPAAQLALESERIRLIEDADGDGIADRSKVFAAGFDSAVDGTAAGVLAGRNQVWLTNLPNLIRLTPDAAGTAAPAREDLLRGFGVHIGFAGHDLQGLIAGPDGKLYFSVGDRGSHVETREGKVIDLPDTGAVFRCNPDGSSLEVVATGLRNPRDLAFDELGNLFAGDSDSGHGDRARFVQVVEGGDSGWRIGFQNAPLGQGGPWMREGLWRPRFEGQAAYLLPPVANIERGPSGLAYYPGTGLSSDCLGRFFLCHLNGSPAASSIRTYALSPVGAGFDLVETGIFLRGAMPTDVTFGPDGRLYFSDWVSGWPWPKSGRGRIHAVAAANPAATELAAAAETRQLMAAGMAGRSTEVLASDLGHRDQRVRLAAQFELAGRGAASLPVLETLAGNAGAPRLARLHALWGMGQLAGRVPAALNRLPALFADQDREVRAQAARLLGDHLRIEAFRSLRTALQDPEPRVAFFAAQSLGKLKFKEAIPALIGLLRRNDDQDAALRHAIVVALSRLGPDPALANTANDPSRAVRLGGLLAYRRLEDPAVAAFLGDFDPYVVREAALAINDVPIAGALPALAALLESAPLDDEALVRRALNAHFRLGQPENAAALAAFAGHAYVPARFRSEALQHLARWAEPPARDRLTGLRSNLPPRDAEPARKALVDFLGQLSGKVPEEVQVATINAVAELRIRGTGHALWDVVYQASRPVGARIAALQALEKLDDLRLEVAAQHSARSEQVELRLAALPVLARRDPAVSLPLFGLVARTGTAAELRLVYSFLGRITEPRADEILVQAMHRLAAGEVPLAAEAELLDAVADSPNPELAAVVTRFQDGWRAGPDRLAPFRNALAGGSPADGRRLFERHPRLACLKCHEAGQGAGAAGPDLSAIGRSRSKEFLLESVLFPNAKITPGFARISLTVSGRDAETGILQGESESELLLRRGDGTTMRIQKKDVTRREMLPSSMPEGVGQWLTRRELRDLVAYLADLKGPSIDAARTNTEQPGVSP